RAPLGRNLSCRFGCRGGNECRSRGDPRCLSGRRRSRVSYRYGVRPDPLSTWLPSNGNCWRDRRYRRCRPALSLDHRAMRNALSLVATRASGLKSQFGTMGKPYNAGIAAANGVEAASLAKRGFVSCEDGVAGPQGFIATHSDGPDADTAWADPPPRRWILED